MITVKRCILALATLWLAACDQTRFVIDPAGDAPICEVDVAGLWVVEESERVVTDVLDIAADCRVRYFSMSEDHKGPLPSEAEFTAKIAKLGGRIYVTLTTAALRDIANETKPSTGDGFHVFRLDPGRGTLKLYDVDHKRVAKLIIDGTMKGEIVKTSEELRNVVQGDAATIRTLLARERLFQQAPMVFKRGQAEEMPKPIRDALAAPWKDKGK